ncbi:LysR family transcriptional regulator, chromosome initiation inhibitor [Desulfuromusa kysingii]|uniref:LysR family transcriptional regulator, chromosome initiation inhibitor n=1 Tax=Desulfuromusa kysingii TaxID=37625 RepID=A0A1H4DGR0_9BACT|nr:LysR family transcriptional regulator ArgP [Desulfuromusa kysingii]SEA71738.1 LysR family transcriptional regulator, chromosome initiation inhibitor [Desulfuromusa kysingii]
MLDYKHLEALANVVAEGGFERAAQALFLTQSAVSQRIRQLEESCGQILISRTTPPTPTAAGTALIKHYQQVKLLEAGLSSELTTAPEANMTTLAIGVNADSLAYWFIPAISPVLARKGLLIDLRVDDQEQTHKFLRKGEVIGCVSTEASPIQGCRVEKLGTITYRLLATPDFINHWFADGFSLDASRQAPAVLFNRKDRLHQQFYQQYFGRSPEVFPTHYVPAPEQFFEVIAAGHCHGMVPDWQSAAGLASGQLQELAPGTTMRMSLYWHCWNLAAQPLQDFSQQLLINASQYLDD